MTKRVVMFDYRHVMVRLLFVLVVAPALFGQRPKARQERVPTGAYVPRDSRQQYKIVTEGTAYGLEEGQDRWFSPSGAPTFVRRKKTWSAARDGSWHRAAPARAAA